jgi:hypothetical protein
VSLPARLLAGAVGAAFAWAGANKVTNPAQWRSAARAQGLPVAVAVVVPPVELVLGVCLVVLPPFAPVYGLATLLLLIFTVFLAVQVVSGSTVPCACFDAGMIAALFAAAALN